MISNYKNYFRVLIIIIYFLLNSGCSGCSYFYLTVESTDHSSNSSSKLPLIITASLLNSDVDEGEIVFLNFNINNPNHFGFKINYEIKLLNPIVDTSDFAIQSDFLDFLPGTTSYQLNLQTLHDLNIESDKIYAINFTYSENSQNSAGIDLLLSTSELMFNVLNNDFISTLSITNSTEIETDSNFESTNGFQVTLDRSSDQTITVHYTSSSLYATNGIDFILPEGDLIFNPGEVSKFIKYTIVGDTIGEGLEIFQVTLSNPVNADLALTSTAQGFIEDNDPIVLQVNPLFPINGSQWRDLVPNNLNNDITKLVSNSLDAPCSTLFVNCAHGGELKKVIIPGEYSCNNLTLEDSLGIFEWKCLETTMPVAFYSLGLKANKNLSDLIDYNSFKQNKVNLYKNSLLTYSSQLSIWWTNTITPITLNSGDSDPPLNLNSPNTIYTISGGGVQQTRGIFISADKVSLVVMPGTQLEANTNLTLPVNCNGVITGRHCLIYISGKYSWLEGKFKGYAGLTDNFSGVIVNINDIPGVSRLTLRNIEVNANGAENGIFMQNTIGGEFQSVKVYNANFRGIYLLYLNSFKFDKVESYLNQGYGFYLESAVSHNIFSNISATQNSIAGFRNGNNNIFINSNFNNNPRGYIHGSILNSSIFISCNFSNNINYGFDNYSYTLTSNQVTILHSIINNTSGTGLFLHQEEGMIVNTIINNNNYGLDLNLDASTSSNYKNIYLWGNGTGLTLQSSFKNDNWKGKLFLNNTINCNALNGAQNNRGLDTNCQPIGPSTATLITNHNGSAIFEGYKSDLINIHSSGSILFELISDWFSFENNYRFWILNSNQKGACNSNGQSCGIFDWKLKSNVSELVNINGIFIPNQPCPISVSGDESLISITNNYNPFLLHAVEIIGDYIGDDDGLCDSNESCFYQPNIGYSLYDSSKTYNSCIYQDGIGANKVIGVKMYGE